MGCITWLYRVDVDGCLVIKRWLKRKILDFKVISVRFTDVEATRFELLGLTYAGVAELADALGSGPSGS